MAAVMGRTELGVKEFGTTVTIPTDPRARLMYYLDCICVVLDLSQQGNLSKLRDYTKYYLLSENEIDTLVSLCFLVSPDTLNGKVLFQDDSMCGDSNNQFYEISAVRHNLLLTESILIGGKETHVSKIMAYKQQWILTNWINPMQHFATRLARIAAGGAAEEQQRPAITYNQQQAPAITYNQQQAPPVTYNQYQHQTQQSDDCCCTIL